jgi:hypothetical protein
MKTTTFLATLLVATMSFAQIPNYLPTGGLVAWYPFNANATDESGNGFNGTVSNVALTTDRNGVSNSAYFWPSTNDTNRYINIGFLQTQIPNSISISAWILADGGTIYPRIISSGDIGFYSVGTSNSSRTYESSWERAGVSPWQTTYPVTSGEWHHLVFTANHLVGEGKIYVDGILRDSSCCGTANSNYPMNDTWNIGRKSKISWDEWGGKLDDIAIYNRVLTQQEITNIFTQYYTGIDELSGSKLILSPNPTKDVFTLPGLEELGITTSLELKDANGKLVKVLDPKTTEFKITDLKAGIYFLEISAGTTHEVIKLIIE